MRPVDHARAPPSNPRTLIAVLAIIGRHWVGAAAPDGTRRLDDPEDHVRGEIAEALKRGVRVIPVLVQGARMPRVRELPESLKGLAARNALALDDEGWESDVQRLAAAIRRALPAATSGGVEIGAAPEPRGAGRGPGIFPGGFRVDRRHALAAVGAAGLLAVVVLFARGRTGQSLQAARRSWAKRSEGSLDGDVVFDLPLDAKQVVLRARFGEAIATVPLQLPPRPS
jgi:hypothetical protein